MRRNTVACCVVMGIAIAGCSVSQSPAPAPSASPVLGASLLASPVPSPSLDPAWSLHPDTPEGYTVGFPDTWTFVFKDSPSFDADIKALKDADLIKFFSDGYKNGAGSGLKLIAAEPRSAQSGFVTNLSVFRVDLGPTNAAPSLDSVASSKVNLFSKNQAITGDVRRQQVQLPAGTMEQLQYSMKPGDRTVAVSTYLGTIDSGGDTYLMEIVIGTNIQDYAGLFDRISKSFRVVPVSAPPPVPSPSPSPPRRSPTPR